MVIRVVVADGYRLSREGLLALLSHESEVEIAGQAGNGHECLKLVSRCGPDVVLLGAQLPMLNGVEVIRRGLAMEAGSRFVILSQSHALATVRAAMGAGASGFLLRTSCGHAELMLALRAAMARRVYLCPEVARTLVEDYRSGGRVTDDTATRPMLTPREREVTQLLSEGYPTREIATRLHVSPKTIGTHREHIMLKLGVSSVAELTRYAITEGLSRLDAPCYAHRHVDTVETVR